METPKSVSELCRFLGMVNQFGKFSHNIAELFKPFRELLSAKKAWLWTQTQDEAFTNLKKELTTPNILTLYNPNADTAISADVLLDGQSNPPFQTVWSHTVNTKENFQCMTIFYSIKVYWWFPNSSNILQKLHNSHQGIQHCCLWARSLVWWLHIRSDIDSFIKQCHVCQKSSVLPREPLITAALLSHPWEKVTSDLFHLNNSTYLIVTDYFSSYPEVIQLKSTTLASVIKAHNSIFSHHGVPSVDLHEW